VAVGTGAVVAVRAGGGVGDDNAVGTGVDDGSEPPHEARTNSAMVVRVPSVYVRINVLRNR
jgi:hypothetical protein